MNFPTDDFGNEAPFGQYEIGNGQDARVSALALSFLSGRSPF
jgi:hypothetical protein